MISPAVLETVLVMLACLVIGGGVAWIFAQVALPGDEIPAVTRDDPET